MPQGGTPPLVPMWPQPHVRGENQNPYPFFPFDPRWGEGLALNDFDVFCLLLRLAWISPRPCYLPADVESLNRMVEPACGRTLEISPTVLDYFTVHPHTGLMYFSPQLKALERLISGENMYALLWDERV